MGIYGDVRAPRDRVEDIEGGRQDPQLLRSEFIWRMFVEGKHDAFDVLTDDANVLALLITNGFRKYWVCQGCSSMGHRFGSSSILANGASS